jgi:hypothetical protein
MRSPDRLLAPQLPQRPQHLQRHGLAVQVAAVEHSVGAFGGRDVKPVKVEIGQFGKKQGAIPVS